MSNVNVSFSVISQIRQLSFVYSIISSTSLHNLPWILLLVARTVESHKGKADPATNEPIICLVTLKHKGFRSTECCHPGEAFFQGRPCLF